ncbi:hypothetical protein ACIBI9_40365 [Nonomuraea sp. NPDC050451]|uniref:hypothetical protein n=1 Tax=Nonomuraea sp. NPDC050451 TaxID=3364364 RepID=UPI0037B6B9C0
MTAVRGSRQGGDPPDPLQNRFGSPRVVRSSSQLLRRLLQELTAPADHLTAHGLVLEMYAGPLAGIYDPSGPGGRPPVITNDLLHTVLRRRANGESVEQIRPDLVIGTGKRKGHCVRHGRGRLRGSDVDRCP